MQDIKFLKQRNEISSVKSGFTIVELLVVIVIIGILAAITIISYTGISQRAVTASIVSDLNNASTQLKLYQVTNTGYPTSLDCSATPAANSICLRSTNGNSFSSYTPNNSTNPPTFRLTATNPNGTSYAITDVTGPVATATFTGWSMISSGFAHTCAIASDNQAYCWGYNTYGQLGNNSTTDSLVPVPVTTTGVLSGKTIKSISAGYFNTCAIASDDKAYCWGWDTSGQLGNNSAVNSSVPVAVDTTGVLSGKTIKTVSPGVYLTCAIASDNLAYCWGGGNLGNNSASGSLVPVAVTTTGVLSGKTMKSIATGWSHTCAIASDNQGYCWGYNVYGQLGNNSTTDSLVAVAVTNTGALSGKTLSSISTSYYHTCAIASDNQAYCWGNDGNGQLGNNSTTQSSVPVAVTITGVLSGKTIKSIATGSYHTCVAASDNQVYCWGANWNGALGNNSAVDSWVPVAVNTAGALSGKTVTSVSPNGVYHTCVIASDSRAYCWGSDANGQLGNNSTTQSLVPIVTLSPY